MPPSARDLAAQKARLRREQESLLKELLDVVDALERASEHWRAVEAEQQSSTALAVPSPSRPQTIFDRVRAWVAEQWARLRRWMVMRLVAQGSSASLVAIARSGREGTELIRQTLLDILHRRDVIPMDAIGRPFDPETMHALGREVSDATANTVVREVVRGYWWGDRVLRIAQVMVSAPPP